MSRVFGKIYAHCAHKKRCQDIGIKVGEICAEVEEYLRIVESGKLPVCEEQMQFAALVRAAFAAGDVWTDTDLLAKYLSLAKYWPFELFPWEKCLTALFLCSFRVPEGTGELRAAELWPRWDRLLEYVARGSGKNALLAYWSMCLASPYNPIPSYDVDMTAPSEQQAERSYKDLYDVVVRGEYASTLKHYYKATKSEILGRHNGGRVRAWTSNPTSKDGLRSGLVAFDELHAYKDDKLIDVFETGLGKVRHPRIVYQTTEGEVRMGPLDVLKERARRILAGEEDDGGFLPFMCCVPSKESVGDSASWYMANPSLEYLPALRHEYDVEYAAYRDNPRPGHSFVVKRCNYAEANTSTGVTSWTNIVRCSRELPDMAGYAAIGALDYARLRDFAAAGFWLRDGARRYWITHSWICAESPDLDRIKAPWRDWVDMGLATLVRAPEIPPEYIAEWLADGATRYDVRCISLDGYRYALMRSALESVGFDARKDGHNNVRLVRPSTIAQAAPLVDSLFTTGMLAWGAPNPLMQWYVNNASARLRDNGNIEYGKQEPVTRKTDGFMALVAAACFDGELPREKMPPMRPLGLIRF